VAAHAASTTLAARRAGAPAGGAASPSGSSPRSSGRRRNSVTSGPSASSVNSPSARHAERQPCPSISHCISGSSTIEPMPTPENATLIASPRRRTNHDGRNSACPE
jgi:hypothetical protein